MTKNPKKVAFTFSDVSEEVRAMTPGERTTEIDIIALGEWAHPFYGKIEITTQTLAEIVANFKANVRKIDIAIDEGHNSSGEAMGWLKDLYIVWDRIRGLIEWTIEWYQSIRDGKYRYFSPEVVLEEWEIDPSTGNIIRNTLVGGGITNRPFFKGLQALKASEMANSGEGGGYSLFFNSQSMKTFSEIKEGLSSLAKISKEQISEARLAFSELPQEEQDTAKVDLDTLEAKVEDETPTPAEEAQKDTDEKIEDPTPPVDTPPAPPAPAVEEGAKPFSETSFAKLFSEYGVKTVEELSLKFAELKKFHAQETLGKQVDTLIFSESNKTGIVLAKAKNKIMSFAEKLPSQMHSEFLGLFSKEIIAPDGKIFSEIGKGKGDVEGSEDPVETAARKAFAETPEGTDPNANAALTVAKLFAEKSGKAFTECTQDATKYVEGLGL